DIPPFEQKNMRVTGRDDKPPPCLSKERRDKSGGPSKVMWGERGAIIWAMTRRVKREEWLQDIEARQRNVVFPDTVNNEARFWRNWESPLRRAFPSRSEAQHPLRRTVMFLDRTQGARIQTSHSRLNKEKLHVRVASPPVSFSLLLVHPRDTSAFWFELSCGDVRGGGSQR